MRRSPRGGVRLDGHPARRRAIRRAAGPELPPSASEFDESGDGGGVVCERVPEHVEDDMGRHDRAQIAEQRAGALLESRSAAGHAAADGRVAFRLARHERAPDDGAAARRRRDAAAALHRRGRQHRQHQQRHVSRHRRRARPDARAGRGREEEQRQARRRRRLRVHPRTGRRADAKHFTVSECVRHAPERHGHDQPVYAAAGNT